MGADPSTRKAVRLRITGRVHGVWYRGWTQQLAESLGLDGWVRNRLDGSVEALVAGDADSIERFIRACHDGPPAAEVEQVEVAAAQGIVPRGFRQMPTV